MTAAFVTVVGTAFFFVVVVVVTVAPAGSVRFCALLWCDPCRYRWGEASSPAVAVDGHVGVVERTCSGTGAAAGGEYADGCEVTGIRAGVVADRLVAGGAGAGVLVRAAVEA